MDVKEQHIAILCNYELLEDRIGGMDYFFWAFNTMCLKNNIRVDWFFPNQVTHGKYSQLNIIANKNTTVQTRFYNHITNNTTNYTHVITHFVELCTPFFATIKKKLSATVIAVDHNPRPLHGYPLKKKVIKRIKGMRYGKYIDQYIGVSVYTSQSILKDFGTFLKPKTKTIYNGVVITDIIPKTDARAKKNPKFIVVSHLRFSKGIQDLIQAVSNLPAILKENLCIDVFGDGPYKKELHNLVNFYNLEAIFSFKGSSATLSTTYQHYDYMIQPTHMECFSLSILESLAANIPVITTPVGGNEEVILHGENGFIFKAKDIEGLTVLLKAVITGEKQIKINTRKLIEDQFSIDLMVEQHFNVLKHK